MVLHGLIASFKLAAKYSGSTRYLSRNGLAGVAIRFSFGSQAIVVLS